jgi:AcrR family transcriptional regulator
MGVTKKAATRGAGRPHALTLEEVADAVLRVGFDDFTVGKVASELGVDYTTMYRYAPHRDGLVVLGLDRLLRLDGMVLVGPGDARLGWRVLLERSARRVWSFLSEHRRVATEISHRNHPPRVFELATDLGAALVERGFSARNASLAIDIAIDVAVHTRAGAEHLDLARARAPARRRTMAERITHTRPLTSAHADVLRGFQELTGLEPEQLFERSLSVVLVGIEHSLAPKRHAKK